MALVIMTTHNLQLFVVWLLSPWVIPPVSKYSYSPLTKYSVGYIFPCVRLCRDIDAEKKTGRKGAVVNCSHTLIFL